MNFPEYDVDLFSDEVILDPYSHYRAMRDLGPLVWLPRHDMIAAVHFDAVRDILKRPEVFISGEGVAINPEKNMKPRTNTLLSDGDLHRQLKSVVGRPISPPNIDELGAAIRAMADELIVGLVGQGEFDGMRGFAEHLPVEIVSHLVGIPESGRKRMLDWSQAMFNILGSTNERALADEATAREMGPFIAQIERTDLRPGSWGA